MLAKPGSIKPHTKFLAEVYVLNKEEGGRHTPFFTGYRPQFYIRTTDVTGNIELPEGVEMVMPGDNVADEGGVDRAGGPPSDNMKSSIANAANGCRTIQSPEVLQLVADDVRPAQHDDHRECTSCMNE